MEVINSTHPYPDELINRDFHSLFLDGFTDRFRRIREEILAGGCPREFTFLVTFRDQLEVRRCRVMKGDTGELLVINHKIEYLC